ncbi:MAG: PAS domain S-box protein, partial [Methanoregula sp.]|nr:PAS domain S-box protein [Methanoregula sp.]
FIDQVRKHGKVSQFEVLNWRKSGELFNAVVNADTISIGNKPYLIAIIWDITERKRMEEALVESEVKSRSLLENVPELILVHRNGIILYRVAAAVRQRPSGKPVEPYEIDFIEKNGSRRTMVVNGSTIEFDGAPASLIILVDITERKKTEEALRESEERYSSIFDNNYSVSLLIDPDTGGIVSANAAAVRYYGYPRDTLISMGIYDLNRLPKGKVIGDLQRAKNEKAKHFFSTHYLATGEKRNVEIYSGPITLIRKPLFYSVIYDITDRKRAEEALRESEERYREFFTISRDSVFITTTEGRWIEFNDALVEMLGFESRKEMSEVPIPFIYAHPEERIAFTQHIEREGYVKEYPIRLKKKDGTVIDTIITTVPVRNPDGSTKAFIGTIRDVTEKMRAEQETRTLQQFQQSIIDNANVWISVLDPKGTILVWNTTAEEISGYPAEDVIGKNTVWKQLYPDPVYRKQVAENILSIIRTNAYVENFETRIRTKGGDEKIIWWNTQPLRDAAGKPVQFITIGRDNTERKNSEERLRALRQFEESVIKNANIWISVLDGKGAVSVWNRAAEEISGYKADEVIGKNTIWSRIYPDKDYRRTVTAKIKEIIGSKPYLENFETRIRTKDGRERIIWWNTRSLQDVPGINETFIAIGKDVTEQMALQGAIQQANKKLNLLSNLTRHDIVNQLLALNGYLELSRDLIGDPVKLKDYITKEQNIANTIEAQIQFTKDYQEMGIKAPEWQDVHKSVDMAIESLPMRDITVEIAKTPFEVYADPLLGRVFYNLIDNALRYGGEHMTTIRISSQESDHGLLVVCENDGVSVPADKKEAIFNRGYFKHTGFGMFLSREILAITGITIAETGEPGKGARFEMTVPKGGYRFTGGEK